MPMQDMQRICGDTPASAPGMEPVTGALMGPVDDLADIRRLPCITVVPSVVFANWTHHMRRNAALPGKGAMPVQIQISLLLDRARADTLTAQLVSQLRDAIRVGRIAPGARLPSSRRLSEQLGIGRNTVVRAYETLLMECYVESRPASGIFATLPPLDLRAPAPSAASATSPAAMAGSRAAPDSAAALRRHRPAPAASAAGRLSFDFAPGRPNAGAVPAEGLAPAAANLPVAGRRRWDWRSRATRSAWPRLRSAIANHLAAARGIVAEPGQIVIASGTAEAHRPRHPPAVCARVARLRRRRPLSPRRRGVRGRRRRTLPGVPVDDAGIVADDLPARPAALLYVTPAHQYPTGHTLSPAARASRSSPGRAAPAASFSRTIAAPISAMKAARRRRSPRYAPDCTIHLGTFSQSLGAGLRLGYMVVPPALVDAVRTAKTLLNGGSPWLEQAAMAELIRGGSFVSHIMRMRAEYRERRDHLLDALRAQFRRRRDQRRGRRAARVLATARPASPTPRRSRRSAGGRGSASIRWIPATCPSHRTERADAARH